MPLLDHFHPPLSQRRHWDSFHGAWAEAIAKHFNENLLPEHYFAEARVKVGGRVEIDVETFTVQPRDTTTNGGVALWAPPRPLVVVPLAFTDPDIFEVQVRNEEEGPRVVAAIEIVSPRNKDRADCRRMFAVKCASYLRDGVSVLIVDVVTERHGNLHAELLNLLNVQAPTPGQGATDLYATAYRTVPDKEKLCLELWAEALAVGGALPTLPLWILPELSIPVELELTYQAACAARRID
jgi:hypothetical protein